MYPGNILHNFRLLLKPADCRERTFYQDLSECYRFISSQSLVTPSLLNPLSETDPGQPIRCHQNETVEQMWQLSPFLMNCCETSFRSFRNMAYSQALSLKPQPACAPMTQVPVFSSSLCLLSAVDSLLVTVFSPTWSSSATAQMSWLVSVLGELINSPRAPDQWAAPAEQPSCLR